MSLIHCPECGQEISSNAGICVHCGYKFRVCPECGDVVCEESKACPSCGYQFDSAPNMSTQEEPSNPVPNKNFVDEWLAESPSKEKVFRNSTIIIIRVACIAIIALLLIFVFRKQDAWLKENDPIIKLAEAAKTHSLIVLMGGLILFIYFVFQALPYIFKMAKIFSCMKWLETKSFDPKEQVLEISHMNGGIIPAEEVKSFEDAKTCAYLKALPNKKAKYYILCLLEIVGCLVANIIVYIILKNFYEDALQSYYTGQEFSISYIKIFLPLLISTMVSQLVGFLPMVVFEATRDKWFGFDKK